ncbi:MAG: DEAD/DEAH box helicase family protein, partial [Ruminococcus flavefaciens]|nr:DEAD/DEAH box helicase family protein [Ruminococcus flavefaciens]
GGQPADGAGGGRGTPGDRLSVEQEKEAQGAQETAGGEPAVSAPGYVQLSLFPTVEEQAECIAQVMEEEKRMSSPVSVGRTAREVPKGVVARILTSGGNERNSILRIVAFYQKSPSLEDAAAFLRKEYGTGGKGFTVAGEKYALWFDGEGMKIAPGRTANVPGCTLVSWEQAAAQILELLEGGFYAAQGTLDAAWKNEYRELAAELWYLRQDLSEEAVKSGFLPRLSGLYGGFPDSTEKIAGLLEEKESRDVFVSELAVFAQAYGANRSLMRFRHHSPQVILKRLIGLDTEPRRLHGIEGLEAAKGSFITEDEIDRMLARGSSVSEGKMRICSYFMQGHDAKERADFLKGEYGDGGHGSLGYDVWHDSKGIKFTRSDEASDFQAYDTVRMNWNQVQERIQKLIAARRYLSPEELAYTSEYEKIQLARSIYAFYFYNPHTPNPNRSVEWDADSSKRDFRPMLDSPRLSAILYEDMMEAFATVSPEESRFYDILQKAVEDMGAYQREEYSLFTPLPAEKLQEERRRRKETKRKARETEDDFQEEREAVPEEGREPAGELDAIARRLAKKQKNRGKEEADGQLAFDFSAANEGDDRDAEATLEKSVSDPEQAGKQGPEPAKEETKGQTGERIGEQAQGQAGEQKDSAFSRYDLGYGFLGNGLTVWNRLETEHGDYKTVAHIGADRSVKFYDAAMPEAVREQIREIAATAQMNVSATQEIPVFSVPPQAAPEIQSENGKETVPEKVITPDRETAAMGKSPVELYRETLPALCGIVRQGSLYAYLRDRETDYGSAAAELNQELEYYLDEIAESQPELYHAFQSLPLFREWMVEDILERTYQDVTTERQDAIGRHGKEADAPEWAREAEADPVQQQIAPEKSAPVQRETQKHTGAASAEQSLIPNVEEYLNLKVQYPDKLVGVQVGEYFLFYGKDAMAAAPALSAKLLAREVPGLGETFITGGRTWQAIVKKILEHGQSVVIAGQNPERRENAPYEVIKERDIADYIPLGMELTIDGRRMAVDSIDYGKGYVDLRDLEMQGWFPVFRQESVALVRECVEREQEKQMERGQLPEEIPQAEKGIDGQEKEAYILPDSNKEMVPHPDKDAAGKETEPETNPEAAQPSDDSPELEEAKRLIEDFCIQEYAGESADFSDLKNIGIAYGVTENGGFEIQVNVDLLHFSLNQLVDGRCVEKRQYDSLRELIDGELAYLDYDQLTCLEPDIEEQLEADLNDRIWQEGMQGAREGVMPTESGNAGREEPAAAQIAQENTGRGEPATIQTARESTGREWPASAQIERESTGKEEPAVTQTERETTGRESAGEEKEAPPELVEIEGGEIVVTPGPIKVYSAGLPYEIGFQTLQIGPEPPAEPERHNFRITDEALGTGGQKAKFQGNLEAIRTLKQIETENRLATPEEQETLSRYVGWGGLAQAFDAGNEKWGKEAAELKELLSPEEYESARGTVLNAHYTSPVVIQALYKAVRDMDFTPGNILEPSCGIGNFFGLVPEEFKKSKLYGVELDSLTGRIAKQLYQKADITVGGFEATDFPDDFFDLAVGNVPFGEYKVHDKKYDRQNLLIHDYFLVKALDKVRPGGVAAFLTSKGTMDKANGRVREALAQKADLLGAIRLPNNAFKANAGTEVTADILFFQKRGSAPEKLPDWVTVGQTEDGVPLNLYYLQNPEMVLGKMAYGESLYGNATETACLPLEGAVLKEQLAEAVRHIGKPDRELLYLDTSEQEAGEAAETIAADPDVRNFSFTEKDGKLYFRENSRMKRLEPGKKPAERIRGMIAIRDSARRVIDLQLNGAEEEEITKEQAKLNRLYDDFRKKHGLLNSAGNRLAFRQDSSYPLLCSLEVLDEEGNLQRKADMFTKRTIQHRQPVTHVDTAVEALGVSIGERACVDLGFMASLMGGSEKIPQIVSDLKGIIFKDPDSGPFVFSEGNTEWHRGWQTADEYLSGDVREKLAKAKQAAEEFPEFAVNVEVLQAVQPKDLTAPEISVRIGAPWIDTKYYKQFLFGLLQTPARLQGETFNVLYSDVTAEWRVTGKGAVFRMDARACATYGTKRVNAYEIFEASLNQRSVQVFDSHRDAEGKEIRVLNEKETALAQQKQEAIKEAFRDWVFKDPERRADLCAVYNKLFNSIRPREYDGSHIVFSGMNPEIRLEGYQRNAVARILYGGNTLLAHVVGAGKTYEMAAAAMEGKRLGLCKKSMMVVPNHLTEQWGGDFLTLYPGAKVLVATKKDFEPKNRRKFCARIATGDYDAVIIGHSQFEKIPISPARQAAIIQGQIDEIVDAILDAKISKEENFTIKQMERTKKNLEARLQQLYDKKRDDTVTFEELGVDRLFVDEAHSFKNLYTHTKMRNVAGIGQTDAQKSSDMFAKCRYMDEITGGKGVIFATGTPVSNSMVELYTMMRYLQYDMLQEGYRDSTGKVRSLKHFDNWAATFGEQVTAVE